MQKITDYGASFKVANFETCANKKKFDTEFLLFVFLRLS